MRWSQEGRRRPPMWILFLAFLGMTSIWSAWRRRDHHEGHGHHHGPHHHDEAAWREKRHRFRAKMKDAFSVWDEEDEPETSGHEQPSE